MQNSNADPGGNVWKCGGFQRPQSMAGCYVMHRIGQVRILQVFGWKEETAFAPGRTINRA